MPSSSNADSMSQGGKKLNPLKRVFSFFNKKDKRHNAIEYRPDAENNETVATPDPQLESKPEGEASVYVESCVDANQNKRLEPKPEVEVSTVEIAVSEVENVEIPELPLDEEQLSDPKVAEVQEVADSTINENHDDASQLESEPEVESSTVVDPWADEDKPRLRLRSPPRSRSPPRPRSSPRPRSRSPPRPRSPLRSRLCSPSRPRCEQPQTGCSRTWTERRGPVRPSYDPKFREVDEIFEDDRNRIRIVHLYDTDGSVLVEDGPNDMIVFDTWQDTDFSPQLIANVARAGYDRPRNFQRYAMPLIMQNYDLKGQAETGSGKSAAFLLPIIHKLSLQFEGKERIDRHHQVAALIIVPTRDLAIQIMEQGRKFAEGTCVTVNTCYGEYRVKKNMDAIHLHGCDILVGTLGRVRHFIESKFVKVEKLQLFVLDEADQMLAPSEMAQLEAICSVDDFPALDRRQNLLFSATFPPAVRELADKFCKRHSALIHNKTDDVNFRITQSVLEVPYNDRVDFLITYLKEELKLHNGELPKTLIFVRTRRDAESLAENLKGLSISVQATHGERTQQEREELNRAFRDGKLRALVATDLFSRGLDILDLAHVINVHVPQDRNTYVHRIGRTGRLELGRSTTFFDPNHEEDRNMAQTIIDELHKVKQAPPQFLRDALEHF